MKSCELCNFAARMYCESDQASLCWDCDAKVHSANFLVARHSRSLLCHACQSPTAWTASGAKLGPTVSVCESCADGCERIKDNRGEEESQGGNDDEIDAGEDYEGDDDDDDDDDDDELSGDDEDGDNQVVPWSSTPPPAASSSSSEESSSRFCNGERNVSLKRMRENASDLHSDDDIGCSSSHRNNNMPSAAVAARPTGGGEATFVDSLTRPLKSRRIEPKRSSIVHCGPSGPRSAAIVESLKRFHQQDMTSGNNASAAIVDICKLSKNPRAVDFDSSESS
uniref:B box-type domain-containing protein n=1 Tax=Davidia involucrata TaxID=16924 RepID=A0A5B6ZN86_DAVIN